MLALALLAPPVLADNECATIGEDPSDNGATADSYECPEAGYGDGVTYNADGDLTVEFTRGTVTEVEDVGIDLSATGGDSIFFDSQSTTTEIESRAVTGPLLSVTTVNGDIDIDTEEMDADGQTPDAVTHAIFAESTGSGSIDITTTANVDANGPNPDDAIGIEAITNTGDIDLTVASGIVNGNLYAVRVETGESGAATLNIVDGTIGQGGIAIRATGGTFNLNNDNTISGALDFTGLEGGYTFNHNAGSLWRDLNGTSNLGAGVFINAGTIDFREGDAVSAPGTAYTGDGGVFLLQSIGLDGTSQLDCTATTVTGCLDLTGGSTAGQTAILVRAFRSNRFVEALDRPVNAGIVLVDVGGGTSAADHFVLDPASTARADTDGDGTPDTAVSAYAEDPLYGAVLDTGGLFDYALLYNPENQQHVLTSVPQYEALEYAALIHESLSVWHTTSDAVAGRQADLRDGGQRGGWVRIFADQTERDFKPSVTTHGNTFDYDRRYSLYTGGMIAGYDLMADDSHVLGVHLGFMSTKLEHNDSETVDETRLPSSVTFGTYAGWWDEDSGLTLDGTLNVNLLDIEHNVRRGLEDTRSNVFSVGVRAEAGWRVPLSDAFYVQPLATASYVTADIENLEMRDYDARFEDSNSARAALGVRLGGDTALNGDKVGKLAYWLTARAWEEYTDDNNVQFLTDGDPLVIEDDISGTFEEVSLGVEATNPEGNLSAYFSTGATFGGDTDNYNVSVGARLNW